jgi:WhiB family transcriptional regulator, redox-sensing transcriptional regulator
MPLTHTTGIPRYTAVPARGYFSAVTSQLWSRQALCTQTDPDIFFSDSPVQTEQAKVICRQCGVRDECLSHALQTGEEFGVWGGLDRDERRRLLRRQATRPPGTGAA